MDESERRRERLKAMRNEAARGEASPASQVSGFHVGLANPLTDGSPSQEVSRSTPRFDYYTDPMASFSANRRGNFSSHGPRGFVPSPGHGRVPPPHPESWNPRMAMHPFPGPTAYQAQCSFNDSFPCGTSVGLESSFLPHHEMPPGVSNPPGCAVNFLPQSNLPRGANFPIPRGLSGRHDFGFGQGRDRSFKGSYSEVYLPDSKKVGAKRPLEISKPSISNSQSLAEYLADSFNEAVNGDQNT
uniref:Uncharacterized protein n=1 Tax=Kalanchoe fedtschenkoi TaxID=63787 RepID=A0A7N0UX76_KALFE